MSPFGQLPVLPRRVLLPLAELVVAARLAGDVPLPLRLEPLPLDGLGERLGSPGPSAAHDDVRRALEPAADEGPGGALAGLAARGLVDDGVLTPVALAALRVLARGALLVRLDLAVVRRGDVVPLRAWFAAGGGMVTQLSTSGGRDYELAWFDAALWTSQLVRAVTLPRAGADECAVPAFVSMPSELLVAGCKAAREGRPELLGALAADHAGSVRLGDHRGLEVASPADTAAVVAALEAGCRARLRVLLRGRDIEQVPAVASWLLLDDGWHELRPGPGATAELRRREPRDLALWLARPVSVAAGVAR
ncbi:hypothetical protein [Nocardioides sp. LHG3406-4]|uniref:hypothetical protein n=1 Tax=Nocardioides sp. LHG3406-4 TaxID=2804575 RepID=UPI003CEB9575